jgi:tripartite-type tricarboxylate transporter receptor subunit TctC
MEHKQSQQVTHDHRPNNTTKATKHQEMLHDFPQQPQGQKTMMKESQARSHPRHTQTSHRDLAGLYDEVLVRRAAHLAAAALEPDQDVADVLAFLKANPSKMSFGSSGNGSSDHLTAEIFWQQTGTSGVHVPYKGGGPVMQDLLGNQVDSSFMNINTAMPQIQAGKLRALVITSARRSPLLPQVPTLEESGVREANVQSWQAVAGPRGLPADVKGRLHAAIVAGLADPAVRQRLLDLGFEIVANTPEQFAAFQAAEFARWQQLITSRNIKAD